MKALVTFFSRTGNTRKVGKDIAANLRCDIDEITDLKDRSRKIIGWLVAGKDATQKRLTTIKHEKDPSLYDLVVIGTPVWAWTMTPAIRTYLTRNKFKEVAFFCTNGGQEGKTLQHMEQLSKKPLASTSIHENDIIENDPRIKGFCEKIKQVIQ